MNIVNSFKKTTIKNKICITLFVLLGLSVLFYFRYHILYPGVSKVKIVSSEGGVSAFTIPNDMILNYEGAPIYGERGLLVVNLEPGLVSGRSPRYSITLASNGNNNSILRISLPNRIATMDEVESDFEGYKKYIRYSAVGTSRFTLVGKKTAEPVFIECAHHMQISQKFQKLQKCVYYGIYDENIRYQFRFPGVELPELNKLIIYAENKITDLLDKE